MGGMKLATLALCLGLGIIAQADALTLSAPPSAQPGQTFDVTITKSGGTNLVAAAQLSIAIPSDVTAVAVLQGAAGSVSGKVMDCGPTNPRVCLVYGFNQNLLADGIVGVLRVTLSPTARGTLQFMPSLQFAVTPAGIGVPISLGGSVSVSVPAEVDKCDVDGDGLVSALDAGIVHDQAKRVAAWTSEADQDGDGFITIIDWQRVQNAVLTGVCPS